jgi:ATP-dependent Clp protease ATP-binding subunit ClpC
MGARPLRRAIQRYIEDPLADFVLRSELTPGATVLVERGEGNDDNAEPEVKLSIVEGERVPATIGAPQEEAESEEDKILPGEPDQPRSEGGDVA